MESRQNALGMFIGMIRTGISRFTIPFICGMLAVVYTFAGDMNSDEFVDGYLILAVGIAVSAMLQLVFEEKESMKCVRLIEAGVTFSVMGTLVFLTYLFSTDRLSHKIYLYMAEAGIFAGSALTGMIVAATRGTEGSGTRGAFKGAFMSSVIAGAIFSALMLIYAAISILITSLDEVWILACGVLSYASAGCLIFLSFLPRPGEESNRGKAYSVVTGFVLLPLYLLLLTVLYIYLAGILISWELPSGQLNPFGLVATGGFILLWMALKGEDQPLAKFYTRWGGLLLLPVITAQIIGLAVRVSAYGLTPLRVLSIVGVLIGLIAVILCTFRAKIWIFFTAAVAIVMLLTLTPLNPVDISNWDQSIRLRTLLNKYDMLAENETIVAPKAEYEPEDYMAIKSSAEYLVSAEGLKTPMMKIISKDRNLKWLRNIESEEETEWISYIVTEADCILLTGYDYAYSFGHWTRSGEDNEPVIEWVDPKTDEKIHLDLEQLIAMVRENKDMDPNPYGSKNYLTYYIPLEESKRLIVIDERHAFYLKYADIDTVDGKDGISLNGWFLTKES